ncbi:PR-1, partial [Fusarium mundagurra]
EYEYVTHYVTAGGNAPQATYVPEQPAPVQESQPAPVVVKKPKKNPAPQPTYVAAPEPEQKEEPATTQEEAPAATQPSSGSGSSNLDSDQQKALDLHNEARKAVGNGPLTWDDSLASGAQEWADHLAQIGTLEHSQGEDGENLYMGSGSNPFASAVEAFLSEKSQYNGEAISGSNYMSFGHYTQCVWKSTTKVGMAVAKDSSGASWVVARYQKPGNMIGDKPY